MDRLIANQHALASCCGWTRRQPQSLVFWDPEGHEVELMVSDTTDTPLVADADDIPAEHRILGLEGARSFTTIEEQAAVRRSTSASAHDGNRLVLDGERSGRWYFSEPHRPPVRRRPRRRLAPHRLRRRRRRGDPAGARRGQRGPAPVDEDLRPLLLRQLLHDVSRRADGDLHDGAWISARREARRPRRPPLSLASSGAASRQARSRADADRQPAPAHRRQEGGAKPSSNGVRRADGACDRRLSSPSASTTARTRRPRPGSWTSWRERGLQGDVLRGRRAAARAPRAGRARARRRPLDRQPHAHPPAAAGRERASARGARSRPRRRRSARSRIPTACSGPPARAATSSPGC